MFEVDLKGCDQAEREAILSAAWLACASDDTLTRHEKRMLRELCLWLELPEGVRESIEHRAREGSLEVSVPARLQARQAMFDAVARAAIADGTVTSEERSLLAKLGKRLDLDKKEIDEWLDQHLPVAGDAPDPFAFFVAPLHESLGQLLQQMRQLRRQRARLADLPLLWIVAAELPALFGVVFLGWSVLQIVLLFWVENVVIGIFNVAKMMAAAERTKGVGEWLRATAAKFYITPFFILHYGFFCWGHGTFIVFLFGGGQSWSLFEGLGKLGGAPLAVSALFMLFSHGLSFSREYIGRCEYRFTTPTILMIKPYGRVALTHIGIMAGGVLCYLLPRPFAALVIVLKIGFDIVAHRMRQTRLAELPEVLSRGKATGAAHAAAYRRMLASAGVLIVIAGGIAYAALKITEPSRERQRRADEVLGGIRPGLKLSEAVAAAKGWKQFFTSDDAAWHVDFSNQGNDAWLKTTEDPRGASIATARLLELLDSDWSGKLRNRTLGVYLDIGDGTAVFNLRLDSEGRVGSVGPAHVFR